MYKFLYVKFFDYFSFVCATLPLENILQGLREAGSVCVF